MYTNLENDLVEHKCLCSDKNYQKKFDENLKKRFFDTCKFSINKFILLLQNSVYPYKYIDDWEKFIETSSPQKEDFCGLNGKDINDADYTHAYIQKEFVKILKSNI